MRGDSVAYFADDHSTPALPAAEQAGLVKLTTNR
jgi:hypothetical protein